MSQFVSVKLENGKYEFITDYMGKFQCLRNGEPWRDLVGDKAVHALFDHVKKLEKLLSNSNLQIAQLINDNAELRRKS